MKRLLIVLIAASMLMSCACAPVIIGGVAGHYNREHWVVKVQDTCDVTVKHNPVTGTMTIPDTATDEQRACVKKCFEPVFVNSPE